MREIKIELDTLLSLISCAEDYGFKDDVLFDAFAGMMGRELSDEEIERFAREMESLSHYGEEDVYMIRQKLQSFKKEYIGE